MRGRRDDHCSGRYASYWNALLLLNLFMESSLHFKLQHKKNKGKSRLSFKDIPAGFNKFFLFLAGFHPSYRLSSGWPSCERQTAKHFYF